MPPDISPEEQEERSRIDQIDKKQLGFKNILRLKREITKEGKEEERNAKQLAKLNADEQENARKYLNLAESIKEVEKKILEAKARGNREDGAYVKLKVNQLKAQQAQEANLLRTAGGSFRFQQRNAAMKIEKLQTEKQLLKDINQKIKDINKERGVIKTIGGVLFSSKKTQKRQIDYARAAAGGGSNLGVGGVGGAGGGGGAGSAEGAAGGGGSGGFDFYKWMKKKAAGIIGSIATMGLIGAGIAAVLIGLGKLKASVKAVGGALKMGLIAPLSSASSLISGGGLGVGGGAVSGAGATDIVGGLERVAVSIPFVGGLLSNLVSGFKSILDAVLGIDQANTKLARTLGISKDGARALNQEYRDFARTSDSVIINQARLAESQLELTQQLGVRSDFSKELLATNIELKELAGFEVEARKSIAESSIITGKKEKEIAQSLFSQVKGFELATGLAFDFKGTITEAAKQTGVIGLQFANYSSKLTASLMKAKALGFSLKELDTTANSFLDFETSISKEFEAQILTGKELNLTKAREAALNNNLAVLAKEITTQVGSARDFLKMDRIDQEAIAAAVNMTRDSLADVLKKQDMYKRLGADNLKAAQQELQILKMKGLTQEQISEKIGKDTYEYVTQTSTAERIVEVMNKIKATFIEFVENTGLFKFLTNPDSVNSFLKSIINGLASGIQLIAELMAGALEFIGDLPGTDKSKYYGYAQSIRGKSSTMAGMLTATAGSIGGTPAASVGATVVAGQKPATQSATAAATQQQFGQVAPQQAVGAVYLDGQDVGKILFGGANQSYGIMGIS